MLKELRNHLMPNILPLPPRPNYAEIGTSNEMNHPLSHPTDLLAARNKTLMKKKTANSHIQRFPD
jgi:hypothetical protein